MPAPASRSSYRSLFLPEPNSWLPSTYLLPWDVQLTALECLPMSLSPGLVVGGLQTPKHDVALADSQLLDFARCNQVIFLKYEWGLLTMGNPCQSKLMSMCLYTFVWIQYLCVFCTKSCIHFRNKTLFKVWAMSAINAVLCIMLVFF